MLLLPILNSHSPDGYRLKLDDEEWVPIMIKQLPVPNAVLHLVKCACVKSKCSSNWCCCRKAGLNCTDLCSCSDDRYQNMEDEHEGMGDDCDKGRKEMFYLMKHSTHFIYGYVVSDIW